MKLSIRMKIFLPVMLILIVFPLAFWLVFRYSLDGHMNYNTRRNLERLAEDMNTLIGRFEEEYGDDTALQGSGEPAENTLLLELRQRIQTETGVNWLVLGEHYRVLHPQNYDDEPTMAFLYSEFLSQLSAAGETAWTEGKIFETSINGSQYVLFFRTLEPVAGQNVRCLILYSPLYDASAILDDVSGLVLLIIAVMASVSILLFWFVAGSISGPVRRLCEAARGIGEKKFQKVETKATVKELCELEDEINQMQDKLLKADEAERVFFQNASHELRTPLMSISGYAQGIQRGVFDDVSQAAGVILDESRRLTEVVDGILTLTRMDQLRYQVVPVELKLNEFVEDQLERLEGLAYQRRIRLEFSPKEPHMVTTDAMLLARAYSNVMSNCIRYAKTKVWTEITKEGDWLVLTVTDDGPGIGEEELLHLFDRFYKGKTGNHGLGLAIARRSMEYMGGTITAESRAGGAKFHIRMPQDCRSLAVEQWNGV